MADKDNPLKREFKYFVEHQDELVKQYRGKFIVIKDEKVIGDYDEQATAVLETQKSHELGTFLVQQAVPGTGAYTQTYHSRVA